MLANSRVIKWILGCVLVAVISFLIGSSLGQRAMLGRLNQQLDSVQASLAFNRLLDERHWGDLLSKGCVAQVEKAVDVAADKDMELLAGFIDGKVDAATIKYISD